MKNSVIKMNAFLLNNIFITGVWENKQINVKAAAANQGNRWFDWIFCCLKRLNLHRIHWKLVRNNQELQSCVS